MREPSVIVFAMDFVGVSTRIGELDHAAVRSESIAETMAVTWMACSKPRRNWKLVVGRLQEQL